MIVLKNTPVNQIFYIMRNAKNESDCWDLTHSTVEFNSNGTYTIAAPKGYDGLSYVTVKVDVEGACTGIETSESEINSAKEGGEHIIGISSSSAWTATASEDWITVTPNSGEGGVAVITITVSENEGEERTGTVTIVNDNGDVNVIDITQEEGEIDYSTRYLTLEATEAGTLKFYLTSNNHPEFSKTIEYSTDGEEWIEVSSTYAQTTILEMQVGDVVYLRGNNTAYTNYYDGLTYCNRIVSGDGLIVNISGNIMSLIQKIGFENLTQLTDSYTFTTLFYSLKINDANNLVLPATTLTSHCYDRMFQDSGMKKAPILTATTLADWCYRAMFKGCDLIEAPALPATVLTERCYESMFASNHNLIAAPELPVATLVEGCYNSMFSGCNSLYYIKCLATDISATNCTLGWVNNVSPTGTFVCPDPSVWTTGASGIPSGWTVETI